MPGAVIVVATDAGLAAAEAFGVREVGKRDPIRLTDRFAIASNAKPMTATVAAILVERGAVRWNSTPAQIWPREAAAMHPATRRLTLEQLLSNSSGIAAFTADEELAALPRFTGATREQRLQFARWLLARPPKYPVGQNLYSNAGFALAGAMLEQASGRSWDELMRSELFEPLAMGSCVTGQRDPAPTPPVPHRFDGKTFVANPVGATPMLADFLAPAGLAYCSAPDLARFGEVHMLGLLGRHPLLKSATFKFLHKAKPGQDYGLGWNVDTFGSVHRGGLEDRWHSAIIVAPKHRIVVAVTVNARALPITLDLMTELIQAAFDNFAAGRAP